MNYIRLLRNLYRLKQNTKKSSAQIMQLQNKKLNTILQFAYEHSAYYRKTFDEAGIKKETLAKTPLSEFPVISKEQLMSHFDELVTAPDLTQEAMRRFDAEASDTQTIYQNKYHIVHSSGSTGTPRYFVYDEAAWEQMLLGILRGGLWDVSVPQFVKWYVSNPRVLYIAATDGRYGGVMAVSDGIDGLHIKQKTLDINTPLFEWASSVQAFQPNFIVGYPSAIKILGELMETDAVQLKVKRIISCGEPLSPGLRGYLESTFQTTVANFYGASESLALGVEVNAQNGMYLFDDLNVIEVIDGDMYLTCLYNFVQPLIRYHISDQLVLHQKIPADPCAFSKADVLLSRNEDVLWFTNKDGKREFLHPLSVEGFCIDGLLDYQFRQTSKDSFEMLAEITDLSFSVQVQDEMQSQMQQLLSEKGLGFVAFTVRFVDQIMPDANTGKKRLIILYQGEQS